MACAISFILTIIGCILSGCAAVASTMNDQRSAGILFAFAAGSYATANYIAVRVLARLSREGKI